MNISLLTGARGGTVTVTGTGFGTTKSAVTVTLGGAVQTVSQVTDTAVTVTLAEGVAKPHPAADIVVNVAGELVIPPSFCAFLF